MSAAVEPPSPGEPATVHPAVTGPLRLRARSWLVGCVALAVIAGLAAGGLARPSDQFGAAAPTAGRPAGQGAAADDAGRGASGTLGGSTPGEDGPGHAGQTEGIGSSGAAAQRQAALAALLDARSRAVLAGDTSAWNAQVDPSDPAFAVAQAAVVRRLVALPLVEWQYVVIGDGPPLADPRREALPPGAAVQRVRLTWRLAGTTTRTEREQYLTVVRRGERWLLAADTDGEHAGFATQRDPWDLGPVRLVRGDHVTLLAEVGGASPAAVERLAREADAAVEEVDAVWNQPWSRRPLLLLPRSQAGMATLVGEPEDELGQIAAVTTGSFEDGLSRGDRVVVNPDAFATLGALGRAVVLTHEITHVATRAAADVQPPIWLSEGFADYVAYRDRDLRTAVVAGEVIDLVREQGPPRALPRPQDFDASEGDVAAAYEGAWLACRMIADRYGERALVRFYRAMSDSAGAGWPRESASALGASEAELTRAWRRVLREVAA